MIFKVTRVIPQIPFLAIVLIIKNNNSFKAFDFLRKDLCEKVLLPEEAMN